MRKMRNVFILKSALNSSQGDPKATLNSIKNLTPKISSTEVSTLEATMQIPYFLLQNKVEEKFEDIYEETKKIVIELLSELSSEEREETALIIGTSIVDLNSVDTIKSTLYHEVGGHTGEKKRSVDSYAKDIADELGLNDYTMTVSTACTSSANAVLEAKNLIQNGIFKYVVVLGLEVFSQMMSSGFSAMKLLSLDSQKPFDKSRDGLVLGEAFAGVLLSDKPSAWSVKGGYSNCNSVTITSVSESGNEFSDVMSKAVELSKIKYDDITAIKAHATSSLSNDLSEINAIKRLFTQDIVFTALKPYVGHTLGACGVLELVVMMATVDDGFLAKTLNCSDSIIPEYMPLQEHKSCTSGIFMLNYFGFGGNNTSLIIQKESL